MSGQRWPIGREIQKTMSHFIARGEAHLDLTGWAAQVNYQLPKYI